MEFFAAPMDTPRLLEKLAEHAPRNPFCSPGFFKAMRRSGSDPWIAGMRKEDQLLSAAGVFLRRGRLNSTLEITSLPTAAGNEEFWCGLFRFSAERGITQIEANSYRGVCPGQRQISREGKFGAPRAAHLVELSRL